MGERIRNSPPSAPRESPDAKKEKITTLLARAKEFSELEQELAARRLLKEPEDEAQSNVFKRLQTEFEAEMPLIGEALASPALIADGLKVCRELVATIKLGSRIAERMADNAMSLKTYLEQYPEEVGPAMSVMREAHDVLSDIAGKERDASKLRDAFNAAGPALEILFSDANPAGEENAVYRILLLTEVLSMADEKNARWIRASIGHHIARCVANDFYLPEVTTANAMQRLEKLAKKPSTEDEYKLTREAVETVLRVNETGENIRDILNAALTQFGLPKDLHKELDAEVETAHESYFDQGLVRMLDQLEYIQDLERTESGATARMHQMFGIRWFSRYPKWLLKEQYEQRNDTIRPYGVFFGASNDWNHKSFDENDTNLVRSVAAKLKEYGYALRVVESVSKKEMQERFTTLDKLYGIHNAQFLLLRAHSSKEGITLGTEDSDGEVYGKDLQTQNLESLRQCLAPGAPIVFDGCAVGRRGGFAQVASEVFETKVIAPPGNQSTLTEVAVRIENGKPTFDARYEAEKDDVQVMPHVYISGRKR